MMHCWFVSSILSSERSFMLDVGELDVEGRRQNIVSFTLGELYL